LLATQDAVEDQAQGWRFFDQLESFLITFIDLNKYTRLYTQSIHRGWVSGKSCAITGLRLITWRLIMADKKKNSAHEAAKETLGGASEAKPAKKVKEIHVKHAANGGHIIKHVHTHPDHHPDEEHTTKGDDELADHVTSAMGQPNPGEAEADAGTPDAGAGAAASAGAPPAGAAAPQAGPAPAAPIPGM
jgi:hypothetical protein